jgi:hypothetical protein
MRTGKGNRRTRRKPAPAPLCPPQIPLDHTRDRTRAAVVGSQRLITWAMARPQSKSYFTTGGLSPIRSSWRQSPWNSRPKFFFHWVLAVIVLTHHPLWRVDGVFPYEYAWPFVKCTYRTCSVLLKILPFAPQTSLLSVQALQSRSCLSYVSYATTAAVNVNGCKLDHRQV